MTFTVAIPHRLAQVWHHAGPLATPALPDRFAARLRGEAAARFRALPASDQAHLLAVATRLEASGANDDLITAGLLHDIGKAIPGSPVRLNDRVLRVLLSRVAPGLERRLAARSTPPRVARGVWALARHATEGAAVAAASGYPARVAWLVAHHEEAGAQDPDLRALAVADHAGFSARPR